MTLRDVGFWLHRTSNERPWFSWLIHGVMALPLVALAAWQPWLAPGLVFAYREGEQAWFRYLTKQPLLWLDHSMDVLVPGCVGWLLLR